MSRANTLLAVAIIVAFVLVFLALFGHMIYREVGR